MTEIFNAGIRKIMKEPDYDYLSGSVLTSLVGLRVATTVVIFYTNNI